MIVEEKKLQRFNGAVTEEILLDQVLHYFEVGVGPDIAMDTLFLGLRLLRGRLSPKEWAAFTQRAALHPLSTVLHHDPLTARSFTKPRGYPGDAYLIDFIYGEEHTPSEARQLTDIAAGIHAYLQQAPACIAVRDRRDIAAQVVDQIAENVENPAILAVAGGHMREVSRSQAAKQNKIASWVCLDQDAETIAYVEQTYAEKNVQAVKGSIGRMIVNKGADLGTFDCIYSLGLYDYLNNDTAKSLTAVAFDMLKPGGVFLFANFAPNIYDQGYMESFMGWNLIMRDEHDMQDILSAVPQEQCAEQEIFWGSNRVIVYAKVKKIG